MPAITRAPMSRLPWERTSLDFGDFSYVSRLLCPDRAANTIQTLNMASAFARQLGSARLFVHDLKEPECRIRERFGLVGSPIEFRALHARRWPAAWYRNTRARYLTYNTAVAVILGASGRIRKAGRPVLFVRSRLEILYWGLMRSKLPWMRDWLFCCEVHDLRPNGREDLSRLTTALGSYDLVVAVTRGLAEDIHAATKGAVTAQAVPLCSALPQIGAVEAPTAKAERVVVGFAGKADEVHGISVALGALEHLPAKYVLRLVGPLSAGFREELSAWFAAGPERSARVEVRPPVDYSRIAAEIDQFDVALLPAGPGVHRSRYTSPLKLFDYLARARAIVAANTECHGELLTDGVNASLYCRSDPMELARCIRNVGDGVHVARDLRRGASRLASEFTYEARAKRILGLLGDGGPRSTAHVA